LAHYRFVMVWVLLFLSVGCTKQIRPEGEAVKKDASLEELLDLYQLRREELPGFKGLMDVTANFPQQGRHTFQATLRSEGDQIRFRVLNLFGGTLFDLMIDGPAVSFTFPSEKKKFEGTLDELEDRIQNDIPPGSIDLLDWLSRAGIPDIESPLIPALEKGEDRFILYLFITDGRKAQLVEKVWIERTAFRVRRVETFEASGAVGGVMTLDDYRNVGGHDFPFSVDGESRGQKISARFKEISILSKEVS